MSRHHFDVFGRRLTVERRREAWVVYAPAGDGKRRPAEGVVIPPDLPEADLASYLADLCHEWASAEHPEVKRL